MAVSNRTDAVSSNAASVKDEAEESCSNTGSSVVSAEEITYITTATRKAAKKTKVIDDDEPLIDTTMALPKRSKKLERLQKRLRMRQEKVSTLPNAASLLSLPSELLHDVLAFLRPNDIFRLQQVNRSVYHFIQESENSIARDIIRRRYWVLSRCFPLPVPFKDVDPSAHPALLSEKRQDMLQIHRKPNQHVKNFDPLKICTCMNCVFSWNNLCLILDLAHWQKHLNEREPIPMIPRGSSPEWNRKLLDANAAIVEKALDGHLLHYAMILEKHLRTTMSTLSRTFRGKKTVHPKRLYHFTNLDAAEETDEFLERSGPPSYEFPWHRDNYYALEAYVPNRKWSKEHEKWVYYANDLHQKDIQWVIDRWTPGGQEGSYVRLWKELRERDHKLVLSQ